MGLVDTSKIVKLIDKLNLDYEIGDDENEIMVFNPKWKEEVINNIENYRIYK